MVAHQEIAEAGLVPKAETANQLQAEAGAAVLPHQVNQEEANHPLPVVNQAVAHWTAIKSF